MAHLKHELEELRISSHHSLSSTPTSAQSYTSDRGSFMDPAHLQVFNELLKVSLTLCTVSLHVQFVMQYTKTYIILLPSRILLYRFLT